MSWMEFAWLCERSVSGVVVYEMGVIKCPFVANRRMFSIRKAKALVSSSKKEEMKEASTWKMSISHRNHEPTRRPINAVFFDACSVSRFLFLSR